MLIVWFVSAFHVGKKEGRMATTRTWIAAGIAAAAFVSLAVAQNAVRKSR